MWGLKEIPAFLEFTGRSDEFPELSDKNWLCDFAFAVDILSHMNELNTKLQGQFVEDLYTNVRAFKSNLLFSPDTFQAKFHSFPHASRAEGGDTKSAEIQKITGRTARKILPSFL